MSLFISLCIIAHLDLDGGITGAFLAPLDDACPAVVGAVLAFDLLAVAGAPRCYDYALPVVDAGLPDAARTLVGFGYVYPLPSQ